MPARFYVPAAPGQTVYEINCWRSEDARPAIEDVFVHVYAVLAWRITTEGDIKPGEEGWEAADRGESIEPVLIEDRNQFGKLWHVMPDGQFCRPEDRTVRNLDAAKRVVLEEEQKAWDQKHEK